METTAKGGRATPEHGNATGFYRWFFTCERENLKAAIKYIVVFAVLIISGCVKQSAEKIPAETEKPKELLTVDFEQSKALQYKFVSSRHIEILLGDLSEKDKVLKTQYAESLEAILVYNPVKVDPYGISVIEANCVSVRANQMAAGNALGEAAKNFAGKSFKFTVGPTGKIEDRSELEKLIKEVAQKAFRNNSRSGRIKESDMVCDFLATQWFLWDSISSIKEPRKGVATGDSWQSQLSIPTPMIMHKGRDVVYKLEEIRNTDKGRIAVISSTFSPSQTPPKGWPIPYTGSFQMSGPFGFYSNYNIVELQGKGQELFNIDAGRSDGYVQDYEVKMTASLQLPLGINPRINIKQHLSMQLVEEPKK
jgi:hypothetical protein